MANAPDTLLVTGPVNQQVSADAILVTPTGGTQTTLAQALAANGEAITPTAITGGASPFPIAGQAGAQGGAVTITGGASSTSANAGGAVTIVGGAPGATGVGGAVTMTGAAGGATNEPGGAATVTAGAGTGTGAGAVASLVGGTSGAGATGAGGAAQVTGGAAASINGAGGAAQVTGGAGVGTGNGGAITITSGAAGATGVAGAVSVSVGGATAGAGSAITLTAGNGAGGTAAGGNLNLVPGTAVSTGVPGNVQVNGNSDLIYATYFFTGTPAATAQVFFIANRPLIVTSLSEVHATAAGGTSTLNVTKDTGTTAPGGGTALGQAAFNLAATANTVQNATPSATIATVKLAAGDRLAVNFANAIQSSAGIVVTVGMSPL